MDKLEQIKQNIRQVVLAQLNDLTSDRLTDDAELFKIGLTSLNTVPLVLGLEEMFGLEFEMNEISYENFQTIAEIAKLVDSKLNPKLK